MMNTSLCTLRLKKRIWFHFPAKSEIAVLAHSDVKQHRCLHMNEAWVLSTSLHSFYQLCSQLAHITTTGISDYRMGLS